MNTTTGKITAVMSALALILIKYHEKPMKYPGRVIKAGEDDPAVVAAIKKQLNKLLAIDSDPELRLDPDNPNFGPKTKQTVRLFQARNLDTDGQPLVQDGEVGSLTWAALFGAGTVPSTDATTDKLLARVLKIAAGEERKKIREKPKNSNKGPEVSEYLRRTGLWPGLAWCCAFMYWCFDEAANALGRENPMVKTGGCLDHWNRAQSHGATRITAARAVNDPSLIKPGMIFIMDYGRGLGHTGIVEKVSGGRLTTIEGNTDASGSREGGGVYRRTRKVKEINKGYIDYSGVGG